jgi:hypothetical protein
MSSWGPGRRELLPLFRFRKSLFLPRRWRLAVAVAVADADAGTVRHWRESCNAENLSFASSLSQSVGGWFMHVVAFRAFAKLVRLRQVQSIESINQSINQSILHPTLPTCSKPPRPGPRLCLCCLFISNNNNRLASPLNHPIQYNSQPMPNQGPTQMLQVFHFPGHHHPLPLPPLLRDAPPRSLLGCLLPGPGHALLVTRLLS